MSKGENPSTACHVMFYVTICHSLACRLPPPVGVVCHVFATSWRCFSCLLSTFGAECLFFSAPAHHVLLRDMPVLCIQRQLLQLKLLLFFSYFLWTGGQNVDLGSSRCVLSLTLIKFVLELPCCFWLAL